MEQLFYLATECTQLILDGARNIKIPVSKRLLTFYAAAACVVYLCRFYFLLLLVFVVSTNLGFLYRMEGWGTNVLIK